MRWLAFIAFLGSFPWDSFVWRRFKFLLVLSRLSYLWRGRFHHLMCWIHLLCWDSLMLRSRQFCLKFFKRLFLFQLIVSIQKFLFLLRFFLQHFWDLLCAERQSRFGLRIQLTDWVWVKYLHLSKLLLSGLFLWRISVTIDDPTRLLILYTHL